MANQVIWTMTGRVQILWFASAQLNGTDLPSVADQTLAYVTRTTCNHHNVFKPSR